MSWPRPVRVIGIGSPLGDDRVAWEVVRMLQQRDWACVVDFHALEGGQRLLDVLDGKGSAVIIDALAPSGKAGTIHRFQWPDARLEVMRPGSTHHLRPAEALQLADTLGLLPALVIVWGIEGERFDPALDLSPVVLAAVPEVIQRIAEELQKNLGSEVGHHA